VDRRLLDLLNGAHPVLATVVGVLLMILGVLVVVYPPLLAWAVGIALFLAGVALLAFVFTGTERDRF
jgi:hypothetical protein